MSTKRHKTTTRKHEITTKRLKMTTKRQTQRDMKWPQCPFSLAVLL